MSKGAAGNPLKAILFPPDLYFRDLKISQFLSGNRIGGKSLITA